MHGLLAIGFMLSAIMAGIFVFQAMKLFRRVPLLLNLPGAVFVGFAAIQFAGWVSHDLFENATTVPPPDVPWYQWLEFLGIAAAWYIVVIVLLDVWRRNTNTTFGSRN